MKTLILFLTICLSATFAFSQTVTSTEAGGDWNQPSTWIGGKVPEAEDTVIINGPVRLLNYNNICKTLTVNAGKDLWAGTGFYGYLKVFGNLVNNGTVRGGMDIYLAGDIESPGQWIKDETGYPKIFFIGSDQHISHAAGSEFPSAFICDDSTVNIYFNSDIHLLNGDSNLGNAEIHTQGHTFKVDGGTIIHARIHSGDTLDFNTTLNGSVEISGNYVLKGTITVFNTTNIFSGTATNLGTLQAVPGPWSFTIDGNIINYGSVTATVLISGNIDNRGSWTSSVTNFTGSNEKTITQSPDAVFEGKFYVLDTNAVIKLGSDVSLNISDFELNHATLKCGSYNLTASTHFVSGTICSNEAISGPCHFENITFEGDIDLHGKNGIQRCMINGALVNYDTISPPFPMSGNYLTVKGVLENKGLITDVPVDLYGDLTNHGEIINSVINVRGDSAHLITISQPIEEPVYLYAGIEGDSYQWMKDGTDIPGATLSYLYFETLQVSDQGVYLCRIVTSEGDTVYSGESSVHLFTGLEDHLFNASRPVVLLQNYPNPFQNATTIAYELKNDSQVELVVLDMKGNTVKTLVNRFQRAGKYEVEWTAPGLPAGLYLCRITTEKGSVTKKLIVK